MFETRAFWGKESNSNINSINCSMNTVSATGFLPIIIAVVVIVIALFLVMTTSRGFG